MLNYQRVNAGCSILKDLNVSISRFFLVFFSFGGGDVDIDNLVVMTTGLSEHAGPENHQKLSIRMRRTNGLLSYDPFFGGVLNSF
jgi:hypothetical protein